MLLMYTFWSEEANHTKRGSKRGKKLVCTRYINTIPELKQGDVLSQNESERLDCAFKPPLNNTCRCTSSAVSKKQYLPGLIFSHSKV